MRILSSHSPQLLCPAQDCTQTFFPWRLLFKGPFLYAHIWNVSSNFSDGWWLCIWYLSNDCAVYTTAMANPDAQLCQLVQINEICICKVHGLQQIHTSKTLKTAHLICSSFHPIPTSVTVRFKCTFADSPHVGLSSLYCVPGLQVCGERQWNEQEHSMSWNWHHTEASVNHIRVTIVNITRSQNLKGN